MTAAHLASPYRSEWHCVEYDAAAICEAGNRIRGLIPQFDTAIPNGVRAL